jgi:hypothetical protein
MNTITLTLSDLQLDLNEIYLNLGYRGQLPDDHIIQMIDDIISCASQFCNPKVGYDFFDKLNINRYFITINNIPIKTGNKIAEYMLSATKIAAFVVTAGEEYDKYLYKLKEANDIVTEFFADAIGSEIAEASVRYVTHLVGQKAEETKLLTTSSYGPGYCGWHVREQKQLFSLFPENPCGIKLNDSSLMHPVKSVSGIIGLGTKIVPTPFACEVCGLQTCFKRKKHKIQKKENKQ